MTTDFLTDNFVAVRMGDVTGNAPVNNIIQGGTDNSSTFKFRINDRSANAGEIISVPFKAVDFVNRQAYQMTIAFDPTQFELVDIETNGLPGSTAITSVLHNWYACYSLPRFG